MTFKEIVDMGITEVIVKSYGYEERSLISRHFEPFGNKAREFVFEVVRLDTINFLEHAWLMFEDEDKESFEINERGECTCFDPELWARPDYD